MLERRHKCRFGPRQAAPITDLICRSPSMDRTGLGTVSYRPGLGAVAHCNVQSKLLEEHLPGVTPTR